MKYTSTMKRPLNPFFCLLLIVSLSLSVVVLTQVKVQARVPQHAQSSHALAPPQSVQSTSNWPVFHGDAARDSNRPADTLLSKANASALLSISGPAFTTLGSIPSSPAIYQGRVYFSVNTLMMSRTNTVHVSTIYAVNARSGQIVWKEVVPACQNYKNQEWILSSPAVTTGMVNGVATTEVFTGWGAAHSGINGCVFDFNGTTGQLIWSFPTSQHVISSPAVMTTNTGRIIVVGDITSFVYAFSVNYTGTLGGPGKQLWKYDTTTDSPPPGYAQYCEPAPTLCGDAVWSSPAEGLVTVKGKLHHYAYFGVGAGPTNPVGRIDAIDLDTIVNGSPGAAWAFWDPHPSPNNDFGTISVLADSTGMAMRVFSGTNTGHLYAVDATSGTMYFDFNTSSHVGTISKVRSNGALATINGTTELVFASGCDGDLDCPKGTANGYLWAINALSNAPNGTLLWQSKNFGSDIVSSPLIVNQDNNAVIFVLGPWMPGIASRGDLLALDPMTGRLLADYAVFNHAYGTVSSPAVSGGQIYVTEGYAVFKNPNPGTGGLAAFKCPGC